MPLQRVGFLRLFGLKTRIDCAHFNLESGMVFNGASNVYERTCSNLSSDDIISQRLRLRMGMDFRGQV